MLAIVILAVLGLKALHQLTRGISYQEVLTVIQSMPLTSLAWSGLFTALSFFALMGYDASGLAYIKAKLPLRTVALGSFAGYALGNAIGMGMITGGMVRLRVYGAAGLEAAQVAKVMAFVAGGFGLGISLIGALGLIWGAESASQVLPVVAWQLMALGGLGVAVVVAVLLMCIRHESLTLFSKKIPLPGWRLAFSQVAISAIDIIFACAALWVLLPSSTMGFGTFLAFFALATALAVISHVPAGVGVFETVMLVAFQDQIPTERIVAALLLYRAIYYLAPLSVALALLAVHEWRVSSGRASEVTGDIAPWFLSTGTFIAGCMLLISGSVPLPEDSKQVLTHFMPLPVIEASHFLASIVGLGLLFIARGLRMRLHAAWWVAVTFTSMGIALAIPKGLAVYESLILGTLTLLLVVGRARFNRKSSLSNQPFSLQWTLMVAAAIGCTIWVMLFVYRDIPYSDSLWWQFELNRDAPRSLRAALAVVLLGLTYSLWQAFRPASAEPPPPNAVTLARAFALIQKQYRSEAMLALTADKCLLFSDSGNTFLMYAKRGRTWAALFDPIGPEAEWPEMIWRFVELARLHGGRAAFYQTSRKHLDFYIDAGLTPHKLGEYASVDVSSFSLQGPKHAELRSALSRGRRDGLEFDVIPCTGFAAIADELKEISDAWLLKQAGHEKHFSLGAFSVDYLQYTPIALLRLNGKIVAFANLMVTEQKGEAAVDLMRYHPDVQSRLMEFLFIQLLLYCQDHGIKQFGMGMAPLSGMSSHKSAPHWQRLGRLIYRHGQHFYNFAGLRAFKEKFNPDWQPRYLCTDGSTPPILVITDIALLVGGGLGKALRR